MAWYDDPRLEGGEYGEYDFYLTERPQDKAGWEWSKYKWKCDDCGKYRHLAFESTTYFYTLDGYDSMNYRSCWKCMLKDKIHCFFWRKKLKMRWFITALKWCMEERSCKRFKLYYKIAKKG